MASIAPLLSILLMAVLGIAKSPLVSTVARLGQVAYYLHPLPDAS
jgi:hypothetical protein